MQINFEKPKAIKFIVLILLLVGAFYLGKINGDLNKTLRYGDTGYPRNCRAIINENYKAYIAKDYSADDLMESINRSCGANGDSWGL